MASGIDEIIVITSPRDSIRYKELLQDGNQWGISIQYIEQLHPNGLPEAFLLCEEKIKNRSVTLMLGDNIIYGSQIGRKLSENRTEKGASIFGYLVKDVSSFGTFEIDFQGHITSLREKPTDGGQGYAIPGIYHFDSSVTSRTRTLSKSERGELEIIDLLKSYFDDKILNYSILDRGTAWLDTGTIEDLSMASELVRVVQSRQGMLVGSPDEVAFRRNLITKEELRDLAKSLEGSLYGKALMEISFEVAD
jgi:glucose-1-phosphate thymidylyltransferase